MKLYLSVDYSWGDFEAENGTLEAIPGEAMIVCTEAETPEEAVRNFEEYRNVDIWGYKTGLKGDEKVIDGRTVVERWPRGKYGYYKETV